MADVPSPIGLGDCNPCDGPLVITATVLDDRVIKRIYYNMKSKTGKDWFAVGLLLCLLPMIQGASIQETKSTFHPIFSKFSDFPPDLPPDLPPNGSLPEPDILPFVRLTCPGCFPEISYERIATEEILVMSKGRYRGRRYVKKDEGLKTNFEIIVPMNPCVEQIFKMSLRYKDDSGEIQETSEDGTYKKEACNTDPTEQLSETILLNTGRRFRGRRYVKKTNFEIIVPIVPNSMIEAAFAQDTEAPNPEDYCIMSPTSSIQGMVDFEINQGTRGCVERTDTDHLPSSIPLGDCNPCEDPLVISATVWKNGKIGPLEYYYIKDTSNFCTVPGNHHVAIGVGVGALIVAGIVVVVVIVAVKILKPAAGRCGPWPRGPTGRPAQGPSHGPAGEGEEGEGGPLSCTSEL